jgi:Family of unknown function (DUF5670)
LQDLCAEEQGRVASRFSKKIGGVRKESTMLWTLFVILLILWGLGLITGHTLGGVIHVLLVIAIVVVLIQVIQGRRRA